MSTALYLVMDQGGHSTRTRVYNRDGECVVDSQVAVTANLAGPGLYEQDAGEVLDSLHQCLVQIDQPTISRIRGAALITQRSSLLACRKDTLEPLTRIISWQDTRNQAWLQQRIDNGELDPAALKPVTGLRLNAHYGASKMRWLLDHDSAVQAANRDGKLLFMPLAAFLTEQLTRQEAVVDAVTASRTFLVRFGECRWSTALLQAFGIPAATLPPLVPTRHTFGDLTIGTQRIPLQVVGGDQSFLPFAYGSTVQDHHLFLNAGTGAFVQTTLALADSPKGLPCSLAALDDAQQLSVAEGTVNACASALDWLFATEHASLSFDAIDAALGRCTQVPVFYHRITALGSPYWLPAAASSFSENASLEEKTVAVIESVIFLLAINIDLLKEAKPSLKGILASGGFSHYKGFCQKLANCTGLEVIRCSDHEASARGAACYLGEIHHYPALAAAERFSAEHDGALLARYQHFHLWLRSEWLKIQ